MKVFGRNQAKVLSFIYTVRVLHFFPFCCFRFFIASFSISRHTLYSKAIIETIAKAAPVSKNKGLVPHNPSNQNPKPINTRNEKPIWSPNCIYSPPALVCTLGDFLFFEDSASILLETIIFKERRRFFQLTPL